MYIYRARLELWAKWRGVRERGTYYIIWSRRNVTDDDEEPLITDDDDDDDDDDDGRGDHLWTGWIIARLGVIVSENENKNVGIRLYTFYTYNVCGKR